MSSSPGRDDPRQRAISDLVRDTYQDPRVVSRYVDIGLWPAEEILVLNHLPDQARLLDVGCGAGRTSIPLAEMGFAVTAVDISAVMVAVARQQAELSGVPLQVEQMDARALRFADASFDAVLFSYNGLELVPALAGKRQALQEFHRVLCPGGVLIFCTHSLFALNGHAPARWGNLLRYLLGRALGIPMRASELGERFIDDPGEEVRYIQILPPRKWLSMLGEVGFEVRLYNTRGRLERRRAWGVGGIWEDGERFYVASKR